MEVSLSMKNPCDNCIVKSMCEDPCDSFYIYVRYHLKSAREYKTSGYLVAQVAKSIRRGRLVLSSRSKLGYIIILNS